MQGEERYRSSRKQFQGLCYVLPSAVDHILGSVSYIANEYDDFNDKITTTKQLGRSNSDEILNLRREVERIKYRQNSTDIPLDELEQYATFLLRID